MSLWIVDTTGDEVFEFADPTDLTTSVRRNLPATLTDPHGVSFDGDGHLWIVDDSGDEVFEFADPTDLTASVRRNLPGTLTTPQGLSFDGDGHMWIVDNIGNEVFEFADPTDLTTFVRRNLPGTLSSPQGMSFDSQGHLWIVDDSGDEVFEFADPTDLTIFVQRNLPSAFAYPSGLSFDGDGHLWIVDSTVNEVFEFADPTDLTASVRRNLPGTLTAPRGMSFDTRLGTDHAVDADAASLTFAVPQPTVTHTAAPDVDPLTLAHWDDTGLAVDFAALIEVEAAPDLYRDSDRGGTQSPIEGELGFAVGETLISRLNWNSPTLRFNDNNNPVDTDIGAYYGPGGDGNGQTIYLVTGDADSQTEASFDVATYVPASRGGGWVNWGFGVTPLPTAVTDLLAGLSAGDRLIIAAAEPETTATEYTVDAGAVTFTFAVPQPTVTHTAAAVHTVDAVAAAFTFAVPQPTVTRTLPDSHAVDATPAAFTFAVPQPAVTSTAAAMHAVDADPAAFTFDVPEPTVTHTGAAVHAVDADPAAFSFAVPQPTVTHTLPDSHAVDATPAAFTFAVPEPAVTSSQPAAHTVDADAAAFTFDVPEPTVTYTAAAVHAVDADPAAFTFAVPQPTVTRITTAPLALADWDDTGLNVDFAALIIVEALPDLYRDSDRGGTQTPTEGELGLGAGETVISRLRWATPTLRFNSDDNPVVLDIGAYYAPGGDGNGQTIYLVTGDGSTQTEVSFDAATYVPASRGGTFLNWGFGTIPLPADVTTLLSGLSAGDRLIFASAQPVAVHAVDANPATFTFNVPQPNVTHGVDASPAAFTFDVPQPSVTSSAPNVHAVDASAAAFTFDVPRPTVTRMKASAHTVDADPAAFTFAVPQPTIVHTGTSAHAVDATPATFRFNVPQPRVTYYSPVTHAIEAHPARFEFVVPPVKITTTGEAASPPAQSAMWTWVRSLHIPWIDNLSLPNRRLLAKGFADVMQHVVDDANAALQELWPATCSPAMLAVWGEVFTRPRRAGETAAEWRQRLVTWRAEPVGQSGWVRDEVERITGDDPPRVIEFPLDGLTWGYGAWGSKRYGVGPSLTVGVEPADRAEVEALLEEGVPPDAGITYLEPSVFDSI